MTTPTSEPELLRAVLSDAPIALIICGPDSSVVSAEGAALSALGDPLAPGQPLSARCGAPGPVAQLIAAAASGAPGHARAQILNAGSIITIADAQDLAPEQTVRSAGNRWWEISARPHPQGAMLIVSDVTSAVDAQIARDELVASVPSLIWYADVDARGEKLQWSFRLINEARGPELLPLHVPEGRTWSQAWVQSRHPDDHQRMNERSTQALTSGEDGYTQSFRCIDSDGTVYWLREEVQINHLEPGRWRLVGVCSNVTELQEQEQRLREFQFLADRALDAVLIFDRQRAIRYANAAAAELLGASDPSDLAGLRADAIVVPEQIEHLVREVMPQLSGGWRGNLTLRQLDGSQRAVQLSAFNISGDDGAVLGTAMIASDLSAQQLAERERQELQQQLIEGQQAALRELSTPLIPLADGVIAMPLIGTIDAGRAMQVMESLLEGIATRQADVAILDITGVRMVDTQVADALLRVARAARLLGAQVVLTGIGADVAQSLVHLGADLSGIATLPNLQAGITYAMSLRMEQQ